MHAWGGPRGVARGQPDRQTEPMGQSPTHPGKDAKENQRRTGVTTSRICACRARALGPCGKLARELAGS
jgi:hypothetical protein